MLNSTKRMFLETLRHPKVSLFRLAYLLGADARISKVPDLRDYALNLPDRYATRYREELAYLEGVEAESLVGCVFPYPRVRPPRAVEAGRDAATGLPYVLHRGGRLHFPRRWTPGAAEAAYRNVLEVEGITGEGCLAKSPHAYERGDFRVEADDVVLDVGCAEALFALDVAARVRKVYLFESDPAWAAPLAATFAPFGGKVRILPRRVCGETGPGRTRLADAVRDEPAGSSYFIKMDIEGAEREVLAASRDFLVSNRVKLACCVYHRQDDERVLGALLESYGFRLSFSDGYMLTGVNGIRHPYFRRGVMYARNF